MSSKASFSWGEQGVVTIKILCAGNSVWLIKNKILPFSIADSGYRFLARLGFLLNHPDRILIKSNNEINICIKICKIYIKKIIKYIYSKFHKLIINKYINNNIKNICK